MILRRYIGRLFIKKLLITAAICLCASFLVETAQSISRCHGCEYITSIVHDIHSSTMFTYSASFFIISISCIWFISSVMLSLELQISTIYRYSMVAVAKNLARIMVVVSLFYIFILDGVVVAYIYKYKNGQVNNDNTVKTAWVRDVSQDEEYVNGSITSLHNVTNGRFGIKSGSASVYTVKNGSISQYRKYNDILIVKSLNGAFFFSLNNAEGGNDSTVRRHNIPNSEFTEILKSLNGSRTHGNVYDITNSVIGKAGWYQGDTLLAINLLQTALSFFIPLLLTMSEVASSNAIRSGNLKHNILRASIYTVFSYTTLEVAKVLGRDLVQNYTISLMVTISLILVFLARLIKKHH